MEILEELNLHLHPNQKHEEFLISILTKCSFIVEKNEIYIDMDWLYEHSILNEFSIRNMLDIRRAISESLRTNNHNYLKLNVSSSVSGQGLFIKNKTKLNFLKKGIYHSNFIHKTI